MKVRIDVSSVSRYHFTHWDLELPKIAAEAIFSKGAITSLRQCVASLWDITEHTCTWHG
jgi:hypothetical protein